MGLQEIQPGTQLELQLTFITPGLGNLTIPCHGLSFCSYDMETLLNETMHEDDREICNSVMPKGQDCNLPLKTGLYNTKGSGIDISLDEFHFKATVEAKVFFKARDGTKFACWEVMIEAQCDDESDP